MLTEATTIDSFAPGNPPYSFEIGGLFVQANDHVIVFGSFSPSFTRADCSGIVRLEHFRGSRQWLCHGAIQRLLDFGTIRAVAQQPNGRLMVGGLFHSVREKLRIM